MSGIQSLDLTATITVFSGDTYFRSSPKDRYNATDLAAFYSGVYADIRRQTVSYPPRKTFFADSIPCYLVGDEPRFFEIDMFGGQTNVWGGTVLPVTEEDFVAWPLSRTELEPHYEAIAHLIGVAGQHDRLSDFLQLEYGTAPAVRQLEGFTFLQRHLDDHAEAGDYRIHAGIPPSAVDTHSSSPTGCIQCGECMAGCIRDSFYSARCELRRYIDANAVRFRGDNVRAIRVRHAKPEVCSENGSSESFDAVFLCSGCIATTEILMRSLKIDTGPVLQDNAIFQFPIINLSRHSDRERQRYFGLTNLLLLLEPRASDAPLLQVQLYPNVDYLWRTLVPDWSWPILRHPARWLRDRLIWARAYMDATDSYRYLVTLVNDRLEFREERHPDVASAARCVESLRQALRGAAWYVLPFRPVLAHTSAHLAGTFPYGEGFVQVARDGEVMPHVHIADSSCFPKSPVISPTFTIMANARRTAVEALQR